MIKIIFIFLSTFIYLMGSDSQDISELHSEIKLLQQDIKALKENQKQINSDVLDLSDYTEDIEANLLSDKIKFGLGFKTNLDNFTKKYANGDTVKSNNIWSNKLMLKMKADISTYIRFSGRLSMYKYWGSSNIHPYSYYDNMQGRVPSDSSLYVERAYIDIFLNKEGVIPLAITLGRQPSADGPSHQFKDNTSRKATYSALLYDGVADGVILTLNMSNVLHNKKSYLRLGYAKGFGYTETQIDTGNAFVGASNSDIKDTNVYGVFFDTTIPTVEESLIQLSYSKIKDVIANPLDANSTQNKNIGDVDLYGAMLEVKNFYESNLDMFIHYGHSVAKPNGEGYAGYGGLLSQAGDTTEKDGDAIWIGGRYGFGGNLQYKVGFEYNQGSKNWISLTQGSFDVYNKLSTRGSASELYFMYVFDRYFNARVGFVDINYDYSRSAWFVGESVAINDVVNKADELKQLKSIYFKLTINY